MKTIKKHLFLLISILTFIGLIIFSFAISMLYPNGIKLSDFPKLPGALLYIWGYIALLGGGFSTVSGAIFWSSWIIIIVSFFIWIKKIFKCQFFYLDDNDS